MFRASKKTPLAKPHKTEQILNMNNNLLKCALSLTLLIAISACDNSAVTPANKNTETQIQVTDDAGNVITLDKPAQKVIGLAPHVIENLYSAGAGKQLIAGVSYADFPEEATKLPIVGGYNKFNIEMIASMKPDLIVAWQSGTPDHFFAKIKQLGIPLYLDEPSTMEHIADSVKRLGKLTGNEAVANKAAEAHLSKVAELRELRKGKPSLKVFYQVWPDPLYTINGEQVISDLIALCGGVNIFADEEIKAPIISSEAVITNNPDVIITGSHTQTPKQALANWYEWKTLSAVQHDNLFVVNPDIVSRHTFRITQGAEQVCKKFDIARQNMQNKG